MRLASKHIALALIPIIGASVLMAADIFGTRKTTISRPWLRDGTNYTVNFDYDPLGGGSIPATIPPGQMHYPASVSVWANGQQVGTNFFGEVTEKGCFEDRPEDMVAKALSQNLVITTTNLIAIGGSGPGSATQPTNKLEVAGGTYPVQWNTNLPPPQSLMIGDSQIFTNIVISNSYSGTIQIGSNFATAKELSAWIAILDSITRTPEDGTTNAWPTNQTYTVNVADGLWTHTNVIDIHTCFEFCTRMRYVENGLTNDFHAAFVSYTVKTNSP